MNTIEFVSHSITAGAAVFVSGCAGYTMRLLEKKANAAITSANAHTATSANLAAMLPKVERAAAALYDLAIRVQPIARAHELQLEQMDRATRALETGHGEVVPIPPAPEGETPEEANARIRAALLRSVGGVNGAFGKMGSARAFTADEPDPTKPLDVPCPRCADKPGFSTDIRCKLCFGSGITSKQAADDFVKSRDLPGAF